MHASAMDYLVAHADLSAGVDVLEVGSLDVNGSARTPMGPFARSWLGVDVVAGPGVDLAIDAEHLPEPWTDSFGLVVSTEMLEHCERPWRCVAEMVRVCAPGGWVLVTARGFDQGGACPWHHPPDRWRLSVDAVKIVLGDAGAEAVEVLPDPGLPGVLALARKPGTTQP